MRKFLLSALLFATQHTFAQQLLDSTKRLQEVVIRPYFSVQPQLRSTNGNGLIDTLILRRQAGTSFLPAINTVSGLRMEERSPGSYRLSIRGSLLRSPFGVRNIKIYLDEFSLTDAGGNSYLNALDMESMSKIQVLKGPQSSIYGANSGGVVLMSPQQLNGDSSRHHINLLSGSYGLFKENIQVAKQWNKYQLYLSHAFQRSDGYREHSAMKRNYFQAFQQYDYSALAKLTALIFYSDLQYNTPGGLTAAQYSINPRGSRPATAATKSAREQQAAIYSKTLYGGISHEWQLSERIKHVASVYTSYTDFKNPFITNFEHRKEFTLGLRSYLEYEQRQQDLNWKFNLGVESMQTATDFDNYDNNFGAPGAVQAADELRAATTFAFAHFNLDFLDKWLLELSGSINFYRYAYESSAPVVLAQKTNRFDPQFMPRLALSYLVTPTFALHSSVSKGYSAPTLAEVRASDQVINVNLQPEQGWNYEAGFKYEALQKRLQVDATAFYYHLQSAIVRRQDENDAEYFINAGGTRQRGLELALSGLAISTPRAAGIRSLRLNTALTLSRFRFDNYRDGSNDFSGNQLTGVPKQTLSSSADLQFNKGWYLFAQHQYTAEIPLNDANTVFAGRYHLLQAKVGWNNLFIGRQRIEIYAGADNMLNKKYSLGNDLNAFGGRYFNAAAPRNFYAGLMLKIR